MIISLAGMVLSNLHLDKAETFDQRTSEIKLNDVLDDID